MKFIEHPPRKFFVPEFVFGEGAVALLTKYIRGFGGTKALVVSDEGIHKAGLLSKIEKLLKSSQADYVIYKEFSRNPKDSEVPAGVELLKKEKCDVIVAVGGGSPIDYAKCINISFSNNKDILQCEGIDEVAHPGLPLICIPTTAGTSADISQFATFTNTAKKNKTICISKKIAPDISLIDPLMTLTMPPELTARSGMDALVHAVEAFVSKGSSLITDMHAADAIKLVFDFLPGAFREPDNLLFRNKMALASLFAGFAFSNSGLGLVHAMAHSLEGYYDLPHGECNALLLDRVVNLNYESAADKYRLIAEQIGIESDIKNPGNAKDELLQSIRRLKAQIGLDYPLSKAGIKKTDIGFLSENAWFDACIATNPKNVTLDEIKETYEAAL